MATDDENKEGAEGEAGPGPRRGTGKGRGERSTGRGGAPSNREIEAAIASLPPERLAALLAIGQARANRGPSTPKLSYSLERLDAEQARDVIAACDEALSYYEEKARNRESPDDSQATAPIRDVSPEVVAAIFNNSGYRSKPIRHSVWAARTWLASRHGDDTAAGDEAATG